MAKVQKVWEAHEVGVKLIQEYAAAAYHQSLSL